MKNTLRFSTHLCYLKVFLSFLLVITMVTTSLPIAYADTDTNTVNALLNSAFDNGAANWNNTSGEITVTNIADGETATNALELSDGGNAVYQAVTNADGTDFIQGSTFKWGLSFKNTTADDIVALILGLNEPAGNPDQLRQMITWLKGRNIDRKVPDNGQYTVIVYSKPFNKDGTFENKTYDGEDVEKKKENFSLVPTMYCTERFSVSLFTTTSTACKWWEENPNVVFKGWELVGGKKYKLPETEDGEKTLIPDDEQVLFAGTVKVSYTAPTLTAEEKEGKPAEEQEKLRGKRRKLSQRQRNRCGTVTAL